MKQLVEVGENKSSNKIHLKPKKKISFDESEEVTKNSIIGYILKIVLFVIVVPPMLSYAALKQDRDLMHNLTLYDVGFGQKLHMSCIGDGRALVILYDLRKKELDQVRVATNIL